MNLDFDKINERGDIKVRNVWEINKDCIIDVRITQLDSDTYNKRDPVKVLNAHEEEKKKIFEKL